jgi:outer membrane receptor protein involved in Fe transport
VDPAVSDFHVHNGWWQVNATARYAWNERSSVSGRAEYFRDPSEVMLTPATTTFPASTIGFKCFSASLGYNVYATPNVLLRAEGRYFRSARAVFIHEGAAYPSNFAVTTGIAAKF